MEFSNNYGFEFEYSNGRIGKSTYLDEDTVNTIGFSGTKCNDQNIFIFCKKCNTYMEFEISKNNALDGKYVRPVCGKSVRERTPYTQLERENETFLEEWADGDYEEYYDEDDEDEEDSGEYYREVCGELGDYTPLDD